LELRAAMISEGLREKEARSRFWIVDKDGLLHSSRNDLSSEQRVYARPETEVAGWSVKEDLVGVLESA
jgi:malate dehydrogenase (oxaloacetate-decarboxylating)